MKRMESNLILEFLWGYSRIFNVEITGAWHASVMIIRGIEYFRDKKRTSTRCVLRAAYAFVGQMHCSPQRRFWLGVK